MPEMNEEQEHDLTCRAWEAVDDGNIEQALTLSDQILARDESDREGRFIRGFCLEIHNQYRDALREYDCLLSQIPDDIPVMIRRGYLLYLLRADEDADQQLQRVLQQDPAALEALIYRGALRHARGNHPGAEADFSQAVELFYQSDR